MHIIHFPTALFTDGTKLSYNPATGAIRVHAAKRKHDVLLCRILTRAIDGELSVSRDDDDDVSEYISAVMDVLSVARASED